MSFSSQRDTHTCASPHSANQPTILPDLLIAHYNTPAKCLLSGHKAAKWPQGCTQPAKWPQGCTLPTPATRAHTKLSLVCAHTNQRLPRAPHINRRPGDASPPFGGASWAPEATCHGTGDTRKCGRSEPAERTAGRQRARRSHGGDRC